MQGLSQRAEQAVKGQAEGHTNGLTSTAHKCYNAEMQLEQGMRIKFKDHPEPCKTWHGVVEKKYVNTDKDMVAVIKFDDGTQLVVFGTDEWIVAE